MEKRGFELGNCISCFFLIVLVAVILFFLLHDKISLSPPDETGTYLKCIDNACTRVEGTGVNECRSEGSFCGCIDTDLEEIHPSGMNFFLQGTARNATASYSDRCSVSGKLIEYLCDSHDQVINFEISCESLGDYTCASGECFPDRLELEECKDSDGGLNYQTEGQASNGKIRLSDYCTDEGMLAEVYCSQATEEILIELFDCNDLGNSICEYGKCISAV
ncbi:MAG: hypothetical protein ABH864_01695 [archaeon]